MFVMFGAFIVSCGFTHFVEAITFFDPLYRLSGAVKLATAVVSWATVLGLIPLVPRALALRSPEELERQIALRTAELALTNQSLEEEMARRVLAQAEREQLLLREQHARAEAEAASRTKDEFLATLSHELRTPLNAMVGWTHLLRTGQVDQATMDHGLEVLDRNTRAQARLIEDMLDLSRIVSGKLRLEPRQVDLASVVQAALEVVRPAADAREIRLTLILHGEPTLVWGDATRLQQVAWNLLSNAVKFTPRGGRIEVELKRQGSRVELRVSDTGQGMTADFLPHAFERFRQADSSTTRVHGGLGLGLAIVRHLVELHGGNVRAESEGEGKGATFRVHLPVLAVRQDLPGEPARETVEVVNLQGVRVLVVDDEPDARDLLSLVLNRAGAQVVAATCAREALELLADTRPDVLVSDVSMPGEDGYALIQEVRRRTVEQGGLVPAVALTALARGEDRMRALAAGFQMHATKPINPRELTLAVKALASWIQREGS